jgi:hypothetical protein
MWVRSMRNLFLRGDRLTHLNVEANRFRKLLEQVFQRGKGCLNVITTAVAFEPLLFEVTSMLHLLAKFGGIESSSTSDRHGSLP